MQKTVQKAEMKEFFARRTEAREFFMQLLFQMDIQNDFSDKIKDRFIEEHDMDPDQKEYFERLFK